MEATKVSVDRWMDKGLSSKGSFSSALEKVQVLQYRGERPTSFLTLSWESENKLDWVNGASLMVQVMVIHKVRTYFPEARKGAGWGEVSTWSACWPPTVLLFIKYTVYFCFLTSMANMLEELKFPFSDFIVK